MFRKFCLGKFGPRESNRGNGLRPGYLRLIKADAHRNEARVRDFAEYVMSVICARGGHQRR